jgi:hypothetical protein
MSESSKGNLSHVKRRWDDIREYLAAYENATELLRIFDERREKQIFLTHVAAWHLHPQNARAPYTDMGIVREVFDFFA